MTDELTLDSAREKLRAATRVIIDLEGDYANAVENAADAEGVYRHDLAASFKQYRDDGAAVEEARIKAHGDTAPQKRETIAAAGMLKLAGEKLEDARDSRRSLWRLIEWAARKDAAMPARNGPGQLSMDERVPTGWP